MQSESKLAVRLAEKWEGGVEEHEGKRVLEKKKIIWCQYLQRKNDDCE